MVVVIARVTARGQTSAVGSGRYAVEAVRQWAARPIRRPLSPALVCRDGRRSARSQRRESDARLPKVVESDKLRQGWRYAAPMPSGDRISSLIHPSSTTRPISSSASPQFGRVELCIRPPLPCRLDAAAAAVAVAVEMAWYSARALRQCLRGTEPDAFLSLKTKSLGLGRRARFRCSFRRDAARRS